MTDVKFSVPST